MTQTDAPRSLPEWSLYVQHLAWCQMQQPSLLSAGDGPNHCTCGLEALVAACPLPREEPKACPCLHITPCHPDCTCVVGVSSRGCLRCCSYGSPEQQRAKAERLATIGAAWQVHQEEHHAADVLAPMDQPDGSPDSTLDLLAGHWPKAEGDGTWDGVPVHQLQGRAPDSVRKAHHALNVAQRRVGGIVPACDGSACPVCLEIAAWQAHQEDGWQPIETAPKEEEVFFWIVPKLPHESYMTSTGQPIVSEAAPYLHRGKFKTWSALGKATHWRPRPAPPGSRSGTLAQEEQLMPEPPDFDQIARRTVDVDGPFVAEELARDIAEQLRQVWNARGAADCDKLDAEWREGLDLAPVLRAIRSVDR